MDFLSFIMNGRVFDVDDFGDQHLIEMLENRLLKESHMATALVAI